MGYLRDATGSFNAGLAGLSCFLFVSMALTYSLRFFIQRE
jgi:hypothetical protein